MIKQLRYLLVIVGIIGYVLVTAVIVMPVVPVSVGVIHHG